MYISSSGLLVMILFLDSFSIGSNNSVLVISLVLVSLTHLLENILDLGSKAWLWVTIGVVLVGVDVSVSEATSG